MCRNRKKNWFFGWIWTRFSPPSGHQIHLYSRRWKRAILSTMEKNFSPWFRWKDPNRWLKVGMMHCQIVKSAAAGCLSWPLWGGATSVYLLVSHWRPYPDVEGCLVISFVQVLTNLVDVRCIKCTCKGGDWTSFFRKIRKIMNSDQTMRCLVPLFFFKLKTASF